MSKCTATLTRIERMIADAKRRHSGPKLWLLNKRQLEEYRNLQQHQSEFIEQYDRKNGQGSYFEAVLDGAVKHPSLPDRLKRALEIVDAPIIPITATLHEAATIYETYLQDESVEQ